MATSIATRAKGRSPISGIAPPAPLENTFTARSSSWKISLGAKDVNRATLRLTILEVRILNELRVDFAEVLILKNLANSESWPVRSQPLAVGGPDAREALRGLGYSDDLIRHTRESIAREHQLTK